ncbi:MAG: F0F1 ATP synthase subunit B [Atopobiaceae bacterium]|nr:F0F1 ATP synthase subunit B [Atopobiaceae bacterium]
MNTICRGARKICTVGASAALLATLAPSVALAEESASGADILLPKPAEFVPALIAFLVIFAVVAKFVWPSVLKMLDKRQEKIQSDLDAAAKAREEANKDREVAAAGIDEAKQKANEIVSAAKREGEEERARIIEQAKSEAAEIIAKGKGVVDAERRHAMAELSDSVVDLSVDIAGKIIGNELPEQQQRALAEKYLAEVGTPNEH